MLYKRVKTKDCHEYGEIQEQIRRANRLALMAYRFTNGRPEGEFLSVAEGNLIEALKEYNGEDHIDND